MPFILLSIAFLIPGFLGWVLTKNVETDENCSESVKSTRTNKIAVKGAFVIGGLLLIIGLFMVFLT